MSKAAQDPQSIYATDSSVGHLTRLIVTCRGVGTTCYIDTYCEKCFFSSSIQGSWARYINILSPLDSHHLTK